MRARRALSSQRSVSLLFILFSPRLASLREAAGTHAVESSPLRAPSTVCHALGHRYVDLVNEQVCNSADVVASVSITGVMDQVANVKPSFVV